ncbi:armadillo-type protein [Xylaria palmicola]|nr:armadillo-type protein [Xylaria palmicola]
MSTATSRDEHDNGVHLRQVYPEQGGADTDIDIIAIHGLDTKSPDTWEWKDRNGSGRIVNWLKDKEMLPNKVDRVRIFTCNWPAALFQQSTMIQKTMAEISLLLFDGIQRGLQSVGVHDGEERPILFIASCLGGVILIKALVDTGEIYDSIRRATRGIIFLATPFRGTAFREVANWAVPGLRIWARIQDRQVNNFLVTVNDLAFDLEDLVRKFTHQSQQRSYLLFNFYEHKTTSLPGQRVPGLPQIFQKEVLLVDPSSACLDIVASPLALDQPHVLMNKFSNPCCSDFKKVAGKIQAMLEEIRKATPLVRADAWIRKRCYTEDKLKIERLSGEKLQMELCYINLAIVEQRHDGETSKASRSSFSLSARLKIETPNEDCQVELSTIFNHRKTKNGNTIKPRRILIRGQAGVGKTTLCKKIVHDFIQGTWKDLFDRILWIPLRRLKTWKPQGYNLKELFSHEYFSQCGEGELFAKELADVVQKRNGEKTLFVLDGLDEVISGLSTDGNLPQLLDTLLNQPNVIITSRPHAYLPASVVTPELELETIGFYPDQIQEYTTKTCESQKSTEIQMYIHEHPLIEDLVRIPIQLDALCFTWDDDLHQEYGLQTLTEIYQAIELRLWKKDILRLGKKHDQELLAQDQIQMFTMLDIELLMEKDFLFLEYLAFVGFHNDVIDFDSKHLGIISDEFGRRLVLDKFLPHISFLRTSARQGRNYHFLHLTFQEYYAARYFARQWDSHTDLDCLDLTPLKAKNYATTYCPKKAYTTMNYIQKYKYNMRYDVFWRFVTGLVQVRGGDIQVDRLFRAIEDEPRDLFGPAHQRLVMRCLSEVASSEEVPVFNRLRAHLENQLEQWLLFEYGLTGSCHLMLEREFPDSTLEAILQKATLNLKLRIFGFLRVKRYLSLKMIDCIRSYLDDDDDEVALAAIGVITYHTEHVSEGVYQRLFALVANPDSQIADEALEMLETHIILSKYAVQGLVDLLNHSDETIQSRAVVILGQQPNLPENIIQHIEDLLKHPNKVLRAAAAKALCQRSALPESVIEDIVCSLEWGRETQSILKKYFMAHLTILVNCIGDFMVPLDCVSTRDCVIDALSKKPLPEEVIETIAALLKRPDWAVRCGALKILLIQHGRLTGKIIRDIMVLAEDPNKKVRDVVVEFSEVNMANPAVCQAVTHSFLKNKNNLLEGYSDGRYPRLHILARHWTVMPDTAHGIIMTLLQDENLLVARQAIVAGLEHQLALPKIWQTILAWLEKPDRGRLIQSAMAHDLSHHTAILPEAIYQCVIAWLKDPNLFIRKIVLYSLAHQSALPESTLQSVSTLLTDEDYQVRDTAANVLLIHLIALPPEKFYSFLLSIDSQSFNHLYRFWLRRSFYTQMTWYAEGEFAYIDTPKGCKRFPFDQLRSRVKEAQKSLAHPGPHPSARVSTLKRKYGEGEAGPE